MNGKNVLQMVVAGVLCAVAMVVPMFMPKIVLGPMSFTLASHVPVFLAMFISPVLAVAVSIGATAGFFMTTPLIIALRALSHLVFAVMGAWILQHYPRIVSNKWYLAGLSILLAFVHAVSEVLVVTPFFLGGMGFNTNQLAQGYAVSVIGLVGGGTFIHSLVDFSLAYLLWRAINKAVPSVEKIR